MNWVVITSLGILLLALTILPSSAEAKQYNDFISISRSKSCILTDCILVKDLIIHDTSDRKISGDFVLSPSGDYTRSKPMPNHVNWYFGHSSLEKIVFVEPDSTILLRSKNIEIIPSLKEYAPPGNLTKVDYGFGKSKSITYSGVYVGPKCDYAKVGIKQYPDLVTIIKHLQSGCTTPLDNKSVNITHKTKLNYCGVECKHQKFMKEAKILSKSKLIRAGKP